LVKAFGCQSDPALVLLEHEKFHILGLISMLEHLDNYYSLEMGNEVQHAFLTLVEGSHQTGPIKFELGLKPCLPHVINMSL
jgi:hypothetical protein